MAIINHKSLADQIEEVLKSQIVAGNYEPGVQLSINELAERWGTSTTPVRDAVHRLSKSGFLKLAPRKGVYVSELDPVRFREIFDVRTALELLAIESAVVSTPKSEIKRALARYQAALELIEENDDYTKALKYDGLLHDLIVRNSENETLKDLMENIRVLLSWTRLTVIEHLKDACRKSIPEHIAILEAMHDGKASQARRLLKKHLERAQRETLAAYDAR